MKLTGKSLTDFEHFLYVKYDNCQIKPEEEIYWQHFSSELTLFDVYKKLPNELINALIIKWFDSVGIYISIEHNKNVGFIYILDECCENGFLTRQEATEKAIEQANLIYNKMV